MSSAVSHSIMTVKVHHSAQTNFAALWGSANVPHPRHSRDPVKPLHTKLMKRIPSYKFKCSSGGYVSVQHQGQGRVLTLKGVPGWSSQLLVELLHPAGCALSLRGIISGWPFHCFQLLRCQLLLLLLLHGMTRPSMGFPVRNIPTLATFDAVQRIACCTTTL